jgi:hypothetical protein
LRAAAVREREVAAAAPTAERPLPPLSIVVMIVGSGATCSRSSPSAAGSRSAPRAHRHPSGSSVRSSSAGLEFYPLAGARTI